MGAARHCWIAVVLLIAEAALGGCEAATSPSSITPSRVAVSGFQYRLTGSDAGETLSWFYLGPSAPRTALNQVGIGREVIWFRQEISARHPAVTDEQFLAIDRQTGETLIHVRGCVQLGSCATADAYWMHPPDYEAILGALLIPQLIWDNSTSAHIGLVSGLSQKFSVQKNDGRFGLQPLPNAGTPRNYESCNLLDDETVIDLELGLVLECKPRFGARRSIVLDSRPARMPFVIPSKTVGPPASPVVPLFNAPWPLLPGANFTLHPDDLSIADAHSAAASDEKMRAFAHKHRFYALERARITGRAQTSTGPGIQKSVTMELEYVGDGGAGIRASVERTRTFVWNQFVNESFSVAVTAWEPPEEHRWENPVAGKVAARIADELGIVGRQKAWSVRSFEVLNVASSDEKGFRQR
jgi:hypothetical protein